MDNENQKLSELVKRLQSGDGKAFEEIYNLTYSKVYFTALKICKKEEDAEDVLQEAYMYLLNKSGDINNPDAFMSWFNMVVANKSKNLLRKNNPMLFNDYETEQYVLDSIPDEDEEYHPGDDVEQDELKKDVMELIDNLSDDKRTAVVLFYYDEMTTKQIAESLGVNENTVKSRLVQAKKDLAKGVKDLEKKNKSLYGIAPIPLLLWVLRGSAKAVGESFAATGGAAAKLAAINTAANAAASTGAAATAGGTTAKIAGLSVVKKVVAGVVAASIVAGGAVGVKSALDNKEKHKETFAGNRAYTEQSDDRESGSEIKDDYTGKTVIDIFDAIEYVNYDETSNSSWPEIVYKENYSKRYGNSGITVSVKDNYIFIESDKFETKDIYPYCEENDFDKPISSTTVLLNCSVDDFVEDGFTLSKSSAEIPVKKITFLNNGNISKEDIDILTQKVNAVKNEDLTDVKTTFNSAVLYFDKNTGDSRLVYYYKVPNGYCAIYYYNDIKVLDGRVVDIDETRPFVEVTLWSYSVYETIGDYEKEFDYTDRFDIKI